MTQKSLPTRKIIPRIGWRKPAVALAAIGLLISTVALVPSATSAQDETDATAYTLTVLHNNDGESKLLPDADSGYPGIARFVTALKNLQADVDTDGVVTLTSGNNFLASKEFNVSLVRGAPFYDSIALSGLYDAMAVGNHDLDFMDFGPDVAAEFFGSFDPPVVFLSANMDVSAEPALVAMVEAGRLAASTVVETGGDRVGVIGAITPKLASMSTPRGVVITDVADAVNAEVAKLTADGVNKIILVSYLQAVDEDLELIPSLSGVDIAIAGGGDELLRNDDSTCLPEEESSRSYPLEATDADGTTVPVITGPGGYRCIGELTASFDADGGLVSYSGRSVGVSPDETPDPDVLTNVEEPLIEALASLDANILATTEVDLDGRRPQVRTNETNQGNLVADAWLWIATNLAEAAGSPAPQAAMTNGSGIRNDGIIPAGSELSESTTWDISPFGNVVVTLELTRERMKELLEVAYDCIPGICGQFAQVAGMNVVVDMGQPARESNRDGDCGLIGHEGARVRSVVLDDGTVIIADGAVVPGDPLVLVTANFLAAGGDCYPLSDLPSAYSGFTDQRTLATYLSDALGGVVTAEQYPEGGEGRITIIDSSGDDMGDDDMGPPKEEPTG